MQILEVNLLSNDLQRTETFYSGRLGLITINKKPSSVSFLAGRTILTFKHSNKLRPVYHFDFNIPKNKLNEAITWASLKFNLLRIENNDFIADFKAWNAASFYFFDNNGNILEFIARHDLNNKSDEAFSSDSIICISEIGIVTENVNELAHKLITNFNIPVFSKQPMHENFAALGNDNGLLILSAPNRHWYPTDCPAKNYSAKIKLLVDEKNVEIVV
jgi:catechol 2,3-dioxygenase-like lactoylglutathione lyase family enzyme